MFRKIGLIIGAFIPTYTLRHLYYKLFFGYRINGSSRIGMLNFINCNELILTDARIGFLNFVTVKTLELSPEAYINNRNRIKHLNHIIIKENGLINKGNFIGAQAEDTDGFDFNLQNLYVGRSSEIQRHNYFDVVRPIEIGNNVVFGGEGSEIWTHGFETNRTLLTGGVTFGNDIFIGSKCIFTKSIRVTDNVTIAPGSVVYKSITEPGIYSTHQLVKIR
jgi:acetyltransferase-like isoleucine patch superfamily enzyme